jgi:pimeloyl-ACP methyl ester carboxylesterase
MDHLLEDGVSLNYQVFEPLVDDLQEPIVLVHGFASTYAVNWLFPQWVKTLTEDGRRVIVFDHRGHGRSEKLYDPQAYGFDLMAQDVGRLLDHLSIPLVDIMGYSMGARVSTHFTLTRPDSVRSLILGGVGANLVGEGGMPRGLAEAMEAERIEDIDDPGLKIFRGFAESTRSDLEALAACARGARGPIDTAALSHIAAPTLICVGTRDEVAGDPHPLRPLFQHVTIVDIPGRDHNRAVGDRVFKHAVLEFLENRP